MSNLEARKAWLTATELAEACGCAPEKVEALARANHWPRVHGPAGAKIGVEVDAVRRALGHIKTKVHGSLPTK